MRARMYWSYATRSLSRGGQRTLLAIFCVAVGVLAIVSLQLVGNMVNNAFTTNARAGNGGDVSIRSDINPLTTQQLGAFSELQSQGVITNYTAVSAHAAQSHSTDGAAQFFSIDAVDPSNFPIAGQASFINPGSGTLPGLLGMNQAVVTKSLYAQLNAHIGTKIQVVTNDGRTLNVTISGELANAGLFQAPMMLVSLDTFKAVPSSAGLPVNYSIVYANVPGHTQANQDRAKTLISQRLPLATVTTSEEALQQNKDQVQQIRYFLQIVGLLALLIGGVGIINTMQVLLRRRRTEIAMLKTTGYRRADLYVMFGLEAALLGLIGGVIGSAVGVGISFLVKGLVEKVIFVQLPVTVDPVTVASGVLIGFLTALIFGIMPIVQASQIRPLAVLREIPEGSGASSVILSIVLAAVLAVLFFLLALGILQNVAVAVGAVGGAGIFLLLLSLFFGVIVLLISKLPVLERFRWWYVLLVAVAILLSGALTFALPTFGAIFLVISLAGIAVVLLPRTWKSNLRMALRNIGRQKVRTVTTLVALFIGVFTIGLVLALGQNITQKINNAIASQVKFNSFVIAGTENKGAVDAELQKLKLCDTCVIVNTVARSTPVAVDGTPVAQLLAKAPRASGANSIGREEALSYLSGVEGFNLQAKSVPDVTIVQPPRANGLRSRNLGPQDVGTNNIIMPLRATQAPLNLHLGSVITTTAPGSSTPVSLTVVGFYTGGSFAGAAMYSDNSVAQALSGGRPYYVYSLKLEPKAANQTLQQIQQAVPTVQTFNIADFVLFFISYLNNVIVMLTAIASLTMIAGIIIIANAVALAMLERRRELGILKSVGYTSRSVLSEVLVENGIVGLTGGILAMALVTLGLTVLGSALFKTDFGTGAPLVLITIAGTAVLCMVVAAVVAWNATRVRPLEVLRYE